MKRHLMPVVALADTKKITKKMLFAIFSCAVLMLFTAPGWAQEAPDPCNSPTIGTSALPLGTATGCGVLITITGTSGHLVATVTGGGTANGNPYDGDEDQLVGIQNNSSVYIGAIRLSSPPVPESPSFPYTSNLFGFDGDGPCNYFYLSDDEEIPTTYDCYNNGVAVGETQADPFDYEGPNNSYTGISPDYTTGTIRFITPIPPCPPGAESCPGVSEGTTSLPSTWFGMENTPVTVISVGETQQLVTGVTNVFPFGPFTCTSDGCTYGSGVWTENYSGDDAQFTPVSQLTGADYWTLLPVPVCAGPVGDPPFGPFTGIPPTPSFGFNPGDFGLEAPSNCLSYGPPAFGTNFPNLPAAPPLLPPNASSLAIVPYSDYSSPNDPVGIELERDCTGPDCALQSFLWTMQLDYDIDPYSIAGPIGGPVICLAPDVPAPTDPNGLAPFSLVGATDCMVNAITSYTGALPGEDPPPPKGGGSDTKSVLASLFSPAQSESNPVPPGKTVGFPGFIFWSNTQTPSCNVKAPVNCVIDPSIVPLSWNQTTLSGAAVTNLTLCANTTGSGCTAPWVHASLTALSATTACQALASSSLPILGGLVHAKNTDLYTLNWVILANPIGLAGCEVAPVLQFNSETIVSPSVFEIID